MKGAIHKTDIETTLSAAKGFNTTLGQFLLLHHIIISNVQYTFALLRAWFPMCTDKCIK